MDTSDALVAGFVKEAEAKLGIESAEMPPAPPRALAARGTGTAIAGGGMPGMGMPGMPSNPAEMERMLDQISPEQMAKQAEIAASVAYSCGLCCTWLEPLLHTVTAPVAYSDSLCCIRLQPLLHAATGGYA